MVHINEHRNVGRNEDQKSREIKRGSIGILEGKIRFELMLVQLETGIWQPHPSDE